MNSKLIAILLICVTATGWSELAAGSPVSAEGGGGESLPMALAEAVGLALRHNLDVRVNAFDQSITQENISAAREPFDPRLLFNIPAVFRQDSQPQATQLGGAEVLTNRSLQGGFSFSETLEWGTQYDLQWSGSRQSSNNTFSTFNPQFSSSLQLNVTQPLLNGFGRKINRQAIVVAQNDLTVSKEQFRLQVEQTVFQTYQSYWELVFALRDLEVKQVALDLARQQLQRNRVQVDIGTLAPIETVQAEQAVADAELVLIQAEIAVEDAQDNLKQLLNVEGFVETGWETRIEPHDSPQVTIDPVDVDGAITMALERDPQIRQHRSNLRSRELDLAVARDALLPEVNLEGSLGLRGLGGDRIIREGFLGGQPSEIQEGGFSDAFQQLLSGDFRNWSVSLTVSLPLRNSGAKARQAQASIRERQTVARITSREQQIRVEVRRAARQLEGGAESVAAAEKARELAERQLDAEQRKFAVGTTTNFQVLEFQRRLAESRTRELRAIIDLNIVFARLEQAKGSLLEGLGVSLLDAGRGATDR